MENDKEDSEGSVVMIIVIVAVVVVVSVIIGCILFKCRRRVCGRDNKQDGGPTGEILLHFTTHTIISV